MVGIVDKEPVDFYALRHGTRVAKIVLAVVADVDQMGPDRIAAGGNPPTVAYVQVALPGAAVVLAEGYQCVAIEGRIFYAELAAANGVKSHMA